MKPAKYIGNVTIVLNGTPGDREQWMAMVLKEPKNEKDQKRKRQRVGYGLWVPPGGGTEKYDKSQKHAAQRELLEEAGLRFPLKTFRKVGIMKNPALTGGVSCHTNSFAVRPASCFPC